MADNVDTSAASAAEESVPAAPAPAPVPAATVGDALRTARMAQDLTVEQVAAELRIEAKQLHALEDNRFEQIGVPVFVKGYIRQYGQRFGLNIDDLLATYHRQGTLAEVALQPNRAITLSENRQTPSWLVGAVAAATVVVAIVAWWWNGGSLDAVRTRVDTPAAPAEAPAAAPEPAAASAAPSVAVPTPAVAEPAEPAPVAAPNTAAEPAAAEPTVAAVVETVPLEFRFAQESWAEVSDGRGERLLYGLNAAGRQVTVRGEPPFSVLLGNADAVQLRVKGAAYPIPTEGRQGSLARFSVDTAEE